jgi:VCBS repeat-containing protein
MTTDNVVRISELPSFPGTPTGAEVFPVVKSGVTYKYTFDDLAAWMIAGHGINRPPHGQNFAVDTDDTIFQLTGNLLAGSYDPDFDSFVISRLRYNGDDMPFEDGSFQTTYGILFLNADTGDWTFTMGPAARALTTGQVAHEIFTYTLDDFKGGLATSTLTITITGTNSVPVVSSVNGQTPINVTLNGNLLYRNAFDYEPTPLTVSQYVVDGISGVHTAGSSVGIEGVGTITIQLNGDYQFVPVTDWFGPVPTITYTVSDGGNNVSAFLRLAVTPLIPGSRPILLYTDFESLPTSGGEGDLGGYMSVFLLRAGSGVIGTDIKVFIGGVEVGAYLLKEDAIVIDKWPITRVAFRVGALEGLIPGRPYPITVTVSGQESNANLNFIPNPGNIIYVAKNGNDDTAEIGNILKPFRMMQYPERGLRSVYSVVRAGDQVVVRGDGTTWTDLGYDTAWFRFRDPTQQGSTPTGEAGTGWINFTAYPGEDVHYQTQPGTKGGFQGPGSAFNGTCGDWVGIANFRIDVLGGASSDAAPVNMQYNSERWRIVNNDFGPWLLGTSPHLNAACITGQGNIILIMGNYLHGIEGSVEKQNHGTYAGTSAYGWRLCFNIVKDISGGSGMQFNDSDGGTNVLNTPFGIWTGFTNIQVYNNWIENTEKYGITFSDVGAFQGELDFMAWNNVIIGTGLPPLRLNTTTTSSSCLYTLNTIYNCCRYASGTGTSMVRNEGTQTAPGHVVRVYNNIFAFGPDTAPGCVWMFDYSGQGSGYDFKRNVYFPGTQTPANLTGDTLAIYGDPQFVDVDAQNFRLQPTSPAANAATQPFGVELNVEDDFTAAVTRASGGAPDCGAFEYDQPTPYVITAPLASGGPKVGVATTCTRGTWGNAPTSYTRQFTVDGANAGAEVDGTGTASYTPDAGDVYKTLRCVVTATNSEGTTSYTLVIGDIAMGAGGPVNTVAPTLTGTAQSGSTLTVHNGTWTGTVDSYAYQWYRAGIPVSGATGSTYALTTPDVGQLVKCRVRANNHITGYAEADTAETGAVLPSPADPDFVQVAQHSVPSAGTQPVAMPSDVTNNNLLATWYCTWNNHSYNGTFSDNQSHTTGSGDWTRENEIVGPGSGNPSCQWLWLLSEQSGPYTQSVNSNTSSGGAVFILEITGVNPSSVMDIPSVTASGSGTSIALAGSIANTKPNDLVLVGVSTQNTGFTFSDIPAGWTQAGSTDSTDGFQTSAVFYRKCSSIETFNFTLTIDSSVGWVASAVVVKGS